MALTTGTDSYLSQADATTYVSGHYATADAKHIAWDALSSDDKDAYLRRACQMIDYQALAGVKSSESQVLAFPRAIFSDVDNDWYVQLSVPQAVEDAQCEIALYLLMGIPKRVDLQRQGVKSFSLGNLSETYAGKANTLPYEAQILLAPYLAGSVRIC